MSSKVQDRKQNVLRFSCSTAALVLPVFVCGAYVRLNVLGSSFKDVFQKDSLCFCYLFAGECIVFEYTEIKQGVRQWSARSLQSKLDDQEPVIWRPNKKWREIKRFATARSKTKVFIQEWVSPLFRFQVLSLELFRSAVVDLNNYFRFFR